MERLVEQLGKMANAKDRARGHEQSAERLMQQAQKLYESASPEQRERMARWAQQFGNPSSPSGASEPHGADGPDRRRAGGGGREGRGGDPSGASADPTSRRNGIDPDRTVRTEPVDARPKAGHSGAEPEAGREQVVAEWLGQGSTRRDPTAIAATQDRLREAARSAEQAIGDRTVPSRYDRILREYFNRLPAKFAAPPPGSADAPPGNAVPAPAAAPARDGDESGKP